MSSACVTGMLMAADCGNTKWRFANTAVVYDILITIEFVVNKTLLCTCAFVAINLCDDAIFCLFFIRKARTMKKLGFC